MSYTTCGSGGCGCAGSTDNLPQEEAAPVARINGVPLHADGEILPPDVLRQRACTELLRQQAQQFHARITRTANDADLDHLSITPRAEAS